MMNEKFKVLVENKYIPVLEEYFTYWNYKYQFNKELKQDEYIDDEYGLIFHLHKLNDDSKCELTCISNSLEDASIECTRILELLKIPFYRNI